MSRHRRGSDWDAYNKDYDIVASYSSRRNDVQTYPSHKAYIWGKRFGISKVYAHFGAGGFVGASNNGQKYKVDIHSTVFYIYMFLVVLYQFVLDQLQKF